MLSRSSLGSFFGCVPEETHADADYDWKTSQSSKGKTDLFMLYLLDYLFGFQI